MKRIFELFIIFAFCLIAFSPATAQDIVDPNTASFYWDAPASGGPVDGYRLKWGTATGVYINTSADIAGLSQPIAGLVLTQKTTYYFVVVAYNEAGESEPSNEVIARPLARPGKPALRK